MAAVASGEVTWLYPRALRVSGGIGLQCPRRTLELLPMSCLTPNERVAGPDATRTPAIEHQ
jgi:hypothetical protein